MNFTLTPGVYAALNLLSKATRNKVLEAAFAFVICGIRPTNLSKNLLVMFMMVVDSASEGKLTYTPDESDEEKAGAVAPEEEQTEQSAAAAEPVNVPEDNIPIAETPDSQLSEDNIRLCDSKTVSLPSIKKVIVKHRRKKNKKRSVA